jgi:transposase
VKTLRAYKVELDPNNKQRTALRKHAGAARWAYNWGLRQKIDVYEATGKSPSAATLHKQLVALKKLSQEEGGVPWLYEVSKNAPQEACEISIKPTRASSDGASRDQPRKGFLVSRRKGRGILSDSTT